MTELSSQSPSRSEVLAAIIGALEGAIAVLEAQASVARSEATGDESRQESKYDTRAIEAGYLAGAHSKRLLQVVEDLKRYRALAPPTDTDVIDGPSLVALAREGGAIDYFFLGPAAAGLRVTVADHEVLVITPAAPLGRALIGAAAGDETEFGTVAWFE